MKFINTIEVLRPLPVVFNFLSDFSNLPKWNYEVITTEQISENPVATGTVFTQQRRFMGRILKDAFIVTDYKTNSVITIKTIKGEYPFIISYFFQGSDQYTRITNSFELHGGIVDMFGFLLNNRVKKAVAQNLQQLKQLLEN